MSKYVQLDPEYVRGKGKEVEKTSGDMQQLIKKMDSLLSNLQANVKGDAMDGYTERYNKIKPTFQNAKELFDEIAHNLRETANAIEDTDKKIGNQYRGQGK